MDMKMTYRIRFVENEYRKNRFKTGQKPIKRSRYAEQLFRLGAGWK